MGVVSENTVRGTRSAHVYVQITVPLKSLSSCMLFDFKQHTWNSSIQECGKEVSEKSRGENGATRLSTAVLAWTNLSTPNDEL